MNSLDILKIFAAKISRPSSMPNTSAETVSDGVFALVFWAAGIIAIIVLIIAGIMYASSGGDPGKVKTAKNMIIYTIVGLIFIMFATAIVAFVLKGLK